MLISSPVTVKYLVKSSLVHPGHDHGHGYGHGHGGLDLNSLVKSLV